MFNLNAYLAGHCHTYSPDQLYNEGYMILHTCKKTLKQNDYKLHNIQLFAVFPVKPSMLKFRILKEPHFFKLIDFPVKKTSKICSK